LRSPASAAKIARARETIQSCQALRASHRRGSSISGSDGIASAESHMVASNDLTRQLDDGVAEGGALYVLLALHLDTEETLEHGVARLALPVATHGLNER
jgi:hypothetical protein